MQESYFQKKQITEKETEEQLKDKKSKKKWIDLDKAGKNIYFYCKKR